jgi:hypothetical protein
LSPLMFRSLSLGSSSQPNPGRVSLSRCPFTALF